MQNSVHMQSPKKMAGNSDRGFLDQIFFGGILHKRPFSHEGNSLVAICQETYLDLDLLLFFEHI